MAHALEAAHSVGLQHTRTELVHAFGVQSTLRDCIAFHTDVDVLYPVGRHVVVQNCDTRAQSFVPQTQNMNALLAIQVCPKQRYLAVCERIVNDTSAVSQVSIFDLRTSPIFRKVRTLVNPFKNSATGQPSDIIGCAFSGDSKFLVCQTGKPDWTVMVWHWFQSRVVCSVEVPARVSRVTFNPVDSSQLCTSGPAHFRLWRVQEEAIRPFPPFSGIKGTEHVTDHAWTLDDRLIAVTEKGTVLVIDECELRQAFPSSHPSGKPTKLNCVKAFSRGFIVGGDNGAVAVYEASEDHITQSADRPMFRLVKSFVLKMGAKPIPACIRGVCLSPSDEVIAVCADEGISLLNVSSVWLMKAGAPEPVLTPVIHDVHAASVCDMSVCASKPFLVTCSDVESTVRVWDYDSRKVVVSRSFEAPPISVSIHPSGYMVLVISTGRALLCHLLADELKTAADISAKSAHFGRFSNGGGLFAVVCLKNIQVYSTYGGTTSHVGTFSGHTGHISSISWAENDVALLSCSADGAVYRWDIASLDKGTRSGEAPIRKSARYTSAVCGPNNSLAACYYKIVTRKRHARPAGGAGAGAGAGAGTDGGGAGGGSGKGGAGVRPGPGGAGGALDGGRAQRNKRGGAASSKNDSANPNDPQDSQQQASASTALLSHTVSEEVPVVVGWPDPSDMSITVETHVPGRVNRLCMVQLEEEIALFGGMRTGDIAEFQYPVTTHQSIIAWHGVHSQEITGLSTSGDRCFLFSCSADGSIFMIAISESVNNHLGDDGTNGPSDALINAQTKRGNTGKLAETKASEALAARRKQIESITEVSEPLTLVTCQSLSAANYRVKQAEEELQEQQSEYNLKAGMLQQKATEEMQSFNLERQAEKEALEKLLTGERNDRLSTKKDLEEKLHQQEKQHMAAAEELISLYEKKLTVQTAKYEEMLQKHQDLKTASEAKHAELVATHNASLNHILSQFKHKVGTQRTAHADLKTYLDYVKKQYEDMLAQQDHEHDAEVLELKAQQTQQEMELDKMRTKLQGEQIQLQQAVGTLKEQLEKSTLELTEAEKRRQAEAKRRAQMQEATREMEEDVREIKQILVERDNQLANSHRKIKDLERSRRVLQQQLQDLRAALVPQEREIGMLKDQIKELDEEYDRGTRTAHKQEQTLAEKKRLVKSTGQRLKEIQNQLTAREQAIKNITRTLEQLLQDTPTSKWRQTLQQMHDALSAGKDVKQPAARVDIHDEGIGSEFHRQRTYLERSVRVLTAKARREERLAAGSSVSRFTENGLLLREINNLRKENKGLAQRCNTFEAELNAVRSQHRLATTKRLQAGFGSASMGSRSPQSTARAARNVYSLGRDPYTNQTVPMTGDGGRPVSRGGSLPSTARAAPSPPAQEPQDDNNRSLSLSVVLPSTTANDAEVVSEGDSDMGDDGDAGTPGDARDAAVGEHRLAVAARDKRIADLTRTTAMQEQALQEQAAELQRLADALNDASSRRRGSSGAGRPSSAGGYKKGVAGYEQSPRNEQWAQQQQQQQPRTYAKSLGYGANPLVKNLSKSQAQLRTRHSKNLRPSRSAVRLGTAPASGTAALSGSSLRRKQLQPTGFGS